ncbi:MAG: hypothetical protein AB2993_07430 (plasmid) [Candidatus Symbiodolus clandestinus]
MGNSSKGTFLSLRLSHELKQALEEHCSEHGESPSLFARRLLEENFPQRLDIEKSRDSPQKVFRQNKERNSNEFKSRFEILLTSSEKNAISERAKLDGCSSRQWVIDAIRAGLTREPQFNADEINVLGESNYQLLAINRKLRQLLQELNKNPEEMFAINLLKDFRVSISHHIDKVNMAIRASLERWGLE